MLIINLLELKLPKQNKNQVKNVFIRIKFNRLEASSPIVPNYGNTFKWLEHECKFDLAESDSSDIEFYLYSQHNQIGHSSKCLKTFLEKFQLKSGSFINFSQIDEINMSTSNSQVEFGILKFKISVFDFFEKDLRMMDKTSAFYLHVKLHKLLIDNAPRYQCLCLIKVKHAVKYTKPIDIRNTLDFDEYFRFEIDENILSTDSLLIELIKHDELSLTHPKQIGKFSCFLCLIRNHDLVHGGFFHKRLLLKTDEHVGDIYLQASIIISKNKNNSWVFEHNAHGLDKLPSNNGSIVSHHHMLHHKVVFNFFKANIFHVELFDSGSVYDDVFASKNIKDDIEMQKSKIFNVKIACKLVYPVSMDNDTIKTFKLNILESYSPRRIKSTIAINRVLTFSMNMPIGNTKRIMVKISVSVSNSKSSKSSCLIHFSDFMHAALLSNDRTSLVIEPALWNLKSNENLINGHVLVGFDFLHEKIHSTDGRSTRDPLHLLHINRMLDSQKPSMAFDYSRKREYFFVVVAHELYFMENDIQCQLCWTCKLDNVSLGSKLSRSLPFNLLRGEANSHFKWSALVPIQVFQFEWLDELFEIHLRNLIDYYVLCFEKIDNSVDACVLFDDFKSCIELSHDTNPVEIHVRGILDLFHAAISSGGMCVGNAIRQMISQLKNLQVQAISLNMPDLVLELVEWSLVPNKATRVLYSIALKPNDIIFNENKKLIGSMCDRTMSYSLTSANQHQQAKCPLLIANFLLFASRKEFSEFFQNQKHMLIQQAEIWNNQVNMFGKWIKPKILSNVTKFTDQNGAEIDGSKFQLNQQHWADGCNKTQFLGHQDFCFEIQANMGDPGYGSNWLLFWRKSKTRWKSAKYIDTQNRPMTKLPNDKDWQLNSKWEYANNLKQQIWLPSTQQEHFAYRRRKFLKKTSTQSVCDEPWYYARSFDSRFFHRQFFNSFCRTKRLVAQNSTNALEVEDLLNKRIFFNRNNENLLVLNIHIYHAILSHNLLASMKLDDLKRSGHESPRIFFSLKLCIFDQVRLLITKNRWKLHDLVTLNSNPEWSESLEVSVNTVLLDDPDTKLNIPISIELNIHFLNKTLVYEQEIGRTFVTSCLNDHNNPQLVVLKSNKKVSTDNVASLLAEFSLNSHQTEWTHLREPLVCTLKTVSFQHFGLRFSKDFFAQQNNAKPSKLFTRFWKFLSSRRKDNRLIADLVLIFDGRILTTKMLIDKNYGIQLDAETENVSIADVKFYTEFRGFLQPVDIYLCLPHDPDLKQIFEKEKYLPNICAIGRVTNLEAYASECGLYCSSEMSVKRDETQDISQITDSYRTKKENSMRFLSDLKKSNVDDNIFKDKYLQQMKRITGCDIDFWTRYYSSIKTKLKLDHKIHKFYYLEIFDESLECVYNIDSYDRFTLESIGSNKSTCVMHAQISCAKKGVANRMLPTKALYSLPCRCIVRIYVVRAFDLLVWDHDTIKPYLEIKCKGYSNDTDVNLSSKRAVVCDGTIDMEFGRVFEVDIVVPINRILEIRLMNGQKSSANGDLLGETQIDLENRLLSPSRGTYGLPRLFFDDECRKQNHTDVGLEMSELIGNNLKNLVLFKWRDVKKPYDILRDICQLKKIEFFLDKQASLAIVGSETIGLNDFVIDHLNELYLYSNDLYEQFCLNILNTRFKLVREHVETRVLYDSSGRQSGKLHLWVDILPVGFASSDHDSYVSIPASVCIQRRKPIELELRCIVWDLLFFYSDYKLFDHERNVCVKSWLGDTHHGRHVQKTDVHYRSKHRACFNYRFVYYFDYMWQEKSIMRKPEIISGFMKKHKIQGVYNDIATQQRMSPKLHVQIWEVDLLGIEKELIGQVLVDLNNIEEPTHLEPNGFHFSSSKDKYLSGKLVDLFKTQSVDGWWQSDSSEKNPSLTCHMHMSLEILTTDEAKSKPAAKGRSSPNLNPRLDAPDREQLFKKSLMKPFTHLITLANHAFHNRNFLSRKHFLCLFLVIFLMLLFWSLPTVLVNRIVSKII